MGSGRRFASRDHRISRDEVADVGRRDLPFKVIEHIWTGFGTPYEADRRYGELTEGQRSLYVLQWARAEIGNGGFAQFFTNSTGFFARDLPAAARTVSLVRHAAIFEKANALFPNSDVPRDRAAREAAFDSLSTRDPDGLDAELESLDEAFYDLQDEFDTALVRFVEDHPDEFFR